MIRKLSIFLLLSLSFSGNVTDIDGNTYETVLIGEQLWMAENLKVTHYRNGDEIPTGYTNKQWKKLQKSRFLLPGTVGLKTGVYAVYDDTADYKGLPDCSGPCSDVYGNLYNWFAVDDERGLCMEGWHVPSDDEWNTMIDSLGGKRKAGVKLKEAGIEHWKSPNKKATNESGFTALPGGERTWRGKYRTLSNSCFFWTSSKQNWNSLGLPLGNIFSYEVDVDNARYRAMYHSASFVTREWADKQYGFSIRCLGD